MSRRQGRAEVWEALFPVLSRAKGIGAGQSSECGQAA
jgi:hypothetical protein